MTSNEEAQPENGASSERSVSRHSSINGPYRQAKVDNTFPHCHLVHCITGAEETYSRSLLSSGHGFAFWDIIGSHIRGQSHIEQLDAVSLQGMSIGDIGMIDPHGQFIFCFNIFTPADDPLHQGHVPEDFEVLQPVLDWASEVQTAPDYFKPGTVVASEGVIVSKLSEEPLKVSFSSTAREGALLILPHGGSREDLVSTSRLTEYINRHALNWYQFMTQHARSTAGTIPNGSLYLITGCDKAKSWSGVAFPSQWKDAGKKIEMTYEGERLPSWLPSKWAQEQTMGLLEGKDRTFCVFARGIHVSLSDRLWTRHLPYPPIEESSYYNILSSPVVGFQSRIARFRERFMRSFDVFLGGYPKFPFHPAVLLSRVLSEQHPGADVILVDDSVWLNLAKGGHGTLPEILDLAVTVIMSSELISVDRLIGLKPNTSEPLSRPKMGSLRDLFAMYAESWARHKMSRQIKKILYSK